MKMFNNMTLAYKEFKVIYDYIAETIWVWNKCDWYEYNEKCSNLFNLEKNCRVKNHICKLTFDENLKKLHKRSVIVTKQFLDNIITPILSNNQKNFYKKRAQWCRITLGYGKFAK